MKNVIKSYYLEGVSNILAPKKVPWHDKRKEVKRLTCEYNFTPTKGIGYWFYNMPNLTDISSLYMWDTTDLVSLYNTFGYDTEIKDWLPLRTWKTTSLTNMIGTFANSSFDNLLCLAD